MSNVLFWLGIGAAQKSVTSRSSIERRHRLISLVVGLLVALLIVAGMVALVAYQQ